LFLFTATWWVISFLAVTPMNVQWFMKIFIHHKMVEMTNNKQ